MRRLDAEHGVLQEHNGVAHIDIIDAAYRLREAKLTQGALQRRLRFGAAAECVGMSLFKTSGKQFIEKHAQRVLLFRLCRIHEQNLPGSMLAHIAACLQRAEYVIQIIQQNRMPCRPAEQTRGSRQQQRRAGCFFAAHAVPYGLRKRVFVLCDILEIERFAPQHILLLWRADVQAAFIDIRLHDRRDKHGDIEILVNRGADARGTDCLIKRRQGQKQKLSPNDCSQRSAVGAAVAAENDVIIVRSSAGLRAFIR